MLLRTLLTALVLFSVAPCFAQEGPDYEAHAAALRKRVPKTFTVLIQKPFVVVGDESPARVKSRALRTVKWAVDRLRRQYFAKDPQTIIDIWLFRDKKSYRANAFKYFGDEPDTPYGYYTPTHRALVMNISTGGGTLVHEIVHPFVRANFPACPTWFNEGLASLYEQCGVKDDALRGLTNWRLAGLHEALKENRVPSFKALTSTTSNGFYNRDKGTNYAQARYLCYYLQERGLLEAFWKRFVATAKQDPSGYAALQHVLGVKDMKVFEEKTWRPFVLGLTYP